MFKKITGEIWYCSFNKYFRIFQIKHFSYNLNRVNMTIFRHKTAIVYTYTNLIYIFLSKNFFNERFSFNICQDFLWSAGTEQHMCK